MRVDIRLAGLELEEGAEAAVQRAFRLALGRFGPRVSHVAVSVEAASPEHTRGGTVWQVVAHVGGWRRFLVIEADRDLAAACSRAADRARRCVERDLSVEGWRPSRAAGQRQGGTAATRRRTVGTPVDTAAERPVTRGRG